MTTFLALFMLIHVIILPIVAGAMLAWDASLARRERRYVRFALKFLASFGTFWIVSMLLVGMAMERAGALPGDPEKITDEQIMNWFFYSLIPALIAALGFQIARNPLMKN